MKKQKAVPVIPKEWSKWMKKQEAVPEVPEKWSQWIKVPKRGKEEQLLRKGKPVSQY